MVPAPFPPFPPCRCEAVREAFGTFYPQDPELVNLVCGSCQQRAEETRLIAAGYTSLPLHMIERMRALGVDVCTSGTLHFARAWVPVWAAELHAATEHKDWQWQFFMRASTDNEFRDACFTVIALAEHQGVDPTQRLHVYAKSQGVQV